MYFVESLFCIKKNVRGILFPWVLLKKKRSEHQFDKITLYDRRCYLELFSESFFNRILLYVDVIIHIQLAV